MLRRVQNRKPLPHHVVEPLTLDTLQMDALVTLFLRAAGGGAHLFAVGCAGVALRIEAHELKILCTCAFNGRPLLNFRL